MKLLSLADYTVACICPMAVEFAVMESLLDEKHPNLPTTRNQNAYTLGRIQGHNVVIAVMPEIGSNNAAMVAVQLLNDFPAVQFGLLVGIGGGVPGQDGKDDVRLGDIVVSEPTATFGGVVQYDMGKITADTAFERTGALGKPPPVLLTNIEKLRALHLREGTRVPQYLSEIMYKNPGVAGNFAYPGVVHDRLFKSSYRHQSGLACQNCDISQLVQRNERLYTTPVIHYGTIGSANMVIKDGITRERLKKDLNIICLEMEAAGLMDAFPCLVIRGICDYADSHKNKLWQPYAAAVAAAYVKELLSTMQPLKSVRESPTAIAFENNKFQLGLNMVDVPDIGRELFIGRDSELGEMEHHLQPRVNSSEQRVLTLGGIGGIGKSQLAIAYATRYRAFYSSIFWLNATSEATLKRSLRSILRRIRSSDAEGQYEDDDIQSFVSEWLSRGKNSRWLLIFDGHDNPKTDGDPKSYEIRSYFPDASQGSIIITTRLPEKLIGLKLRVQSLSRVDDSLRILETRSERGDLQSDEGARQLAFRLNGLPLALATAGAFLKHSAITFKQYVQRYEAKWKIISPQHMSLPEYQEGTQSLYTTWDLSFTQLEHQNAEAAKLLKLLAYFDNQCIWYELLCAGRHKDKPQWFVDLTSDLFAFEDAMSTLVQFCFVEAHPSSGSYSMHVCVHDWALGGLNHEIDTSHYWLAFDCIAGAIISDDRDMFSGMKYGRLAEHAVRLLHARFQNTLNQPDLDSEKFPQILLVGELLRGQSRFQAAEKWYGQALARMIRVLGVDNSITLSAFLAFGRLYHDQGTLVEAEQMYQKVLIGAEKVLGRDDPLTLNAVNNLGLLYLRQQNLAAAEDAFERALAGKESALGVDHKSTLTTVHNFGKVLLMQGRIVEAEKMYLRALEGREKALGVNHILTLRTVHNLASIYHENNQLQQAEGMYQRALVGKEQTLGPDNISTLATVHNLGSLFNDQGRKEEAELMYRRALAGREKTLGSNHASTLLTAKCLRGLGCAP